MPKLGAVKVTMDAMKTGGVQESIAMTLQKGSSAIN